MDAPHCCETREQCERARQLGESTPSALSGYWGCPAPLPLPPGPLFPGADPPPPRTYSDAHLWRQTTGGSEQPWTRPYCTVTVAVHSLSQGAHAAGALAGARDDRRPRPPVVVLLVMLRRPTSRTQHCYASSLPSSSPCSTGVCQWGAGPATRTSPACRESSLPRAAASKVAQRGRDRNAAQDAISAWRSAQQLMRVSPPPPLTLPADSWLEIEAHHPPPPPIECTPPFHFSQAGGCRVPPLAPQRQPTRRGAPATSLAAAPPPLPLCCRRGAPRRPEMLGRTTTTGPLEPVCAMCTTDWGGRARTHRPPARDLRVQGLYG